MIDFKVVTCIALAVCLANANVKIFEQRIGIPTADPPNARSRAPIWGSITQKLDNFNTADSRTWTMRYLSNDQFYQPGGPIFVFIGGEWTIDGSWLRSGQMYDMARENNGYMFYTEHRFYGRSWPLEDFTTDSLKYIRSQQALADLAHFITTMKETVVEGGSNSKVVVVGSSYAASLATWARLLYPDIIDAAYASSAPLIALADFYQYNEVVGDNIALNSQDCYDILNEGMEEMETYFATNEGIDLLGNIVNTCKPIQNLEPFKAYFYNAISVSWSGVVQYAQPGQIASECYKLTSKTGTSFEKLVAFIREKNGQYCISDYNNFLLAFGGTGLDTSSYRQWMFQTCEEFGFFQTTSSRNQPFGNHVLVDYFYHMCKDIFGEEYTPNRIRENIRYTNQVYGGLNMNISYVVSVHGTVDPWHPLGIVESLHKLAPAFLVQGTSHSDDLRSISPSDSAQMRQVKQNVKDQIAAWISQS